MRGSAVLVYRIQQTAKLTPKTSKPRAVVLLYPVLLNLFDVH
jgi:hypothetical protein